MKEQYILSLEELGFSLVYCGYDDIAAGMLKTNLGELPEESWELIFQTASRSLLTKGILLNLDNESPENSFSAEFKSMIDLLATSGKMLRCYNETDEGQSILTIHKKEGKILQHLVAEGIVHILIYLEEDSILNEIEEFYQPIFTGRESSMSSSVSEEVFSYLNGSLQISEQIEEFLSKMKGEDIKQKTIREFAEDFQKQNGRIVNVSLIETNENEYPLLDEICLFLFSEERSWLIHNTNQDKNENPQLVIKTLTKEDWNETLKSYYNRL